MTKQVIDEQQMLKNLDLNELNKTVVTPKDEILKEMRWYDSDDYKNFINRCNLIQNNITNLTDTDDLNSLFYEGSVERAKIKYRIEEFNKSILLCKIDCMDKFQVSSGLKFNKLLFENYPIVKELENKLMQFDFMRRVFDSLLMNMENKKYKLTK